MVTEQEFSQKDFDLNSAEVCKMLRVRYKWLRKHIAEFEHYQIPGRGLGGREYRFTRQSVEAFKQRYHLERNQK